MAKIKAFTMPKWGIEMSEGTIAEWMVAEGAAFEKGALLALIETDKITNDVEAEAPGRFVRIIAQAGETYPVGALLAVLSDGDEVGAAEIDALIAGFKPADTSFTGDDSSNPEPASEPAPVPDDLDISPVARARAAAAGIDVASINGTGRGGRISVQDVDQVARPAPSVALVGPYSATPESSAFASPMARRLASVHGIVLETLQGTGPRGRICKADVLALVKAPAPVGETAKTPGPDGSGMTIQPMTATRRTIARRLTEAKQSIPHFYVRRRVRADRLLAIRPAFEGERPTVNDLLVRACALALMEVPALNIQVHETAIHRFDHAHIAIAVATDKGLVTPILANADALSVAEISSRSRELVERARAGRLKADEISGGSFSLSNLGGFGVEQFDAIINPPQGAILAVGAARPEPIDDDGAIRIVPVLHLSLSCDHRAIDGADGGRFLAALADLIERPRLLM
ncbi:dihydrolipoamide acetyltransferase component of pyruvate dehydrogenase complex [Sphingomonas sp. DBB INV C78]|uniref:2-oxo acid dehydrogenase subunit E2 n=1 Tax=Sphingomonas sp. DBB INV C78 TaxID=3349434 RepID=UPI0036D24658